MYNDIYVNYLKIAVIQCFTLFIIHYSLEISNRIRIRTR